MRSIKIPFYLCNYLLITFLSLIPQHIHASNKIVNTVKIYTYHDKPPYFMPNKSKSASAVGIYQDFVTYLNTQQHNNLYELHFIPRLRLENLLYEGAADGIIIGVNPLWFKDKEQKKFLWTKSIMKDRDIFLVNSDSRINFNKPKEFEGLRFALTRGSYYKGITELIRQKKITLSATNSAKQNLEMLAHNRTDVTIMSELTANYFFNTRYPRNKFRILKTPHDTFERMMLIPNTQKYLHQELSSIVKKAAADKNWQNTLEKWRVKELFTTP